MAHLEETERYLQVVAAFPDPRGGHARDEGDEG